MKIQIQCSLSPRTNPLHHMSACSRFSPNIYKMWMTNQNKNNKVLPSQVSTHFQKKKKKPIHKSGEKKGVKASTFVTFQLSHLKYGPIWNSTHAVPKFPNFAPPTPISQNYKNSAIAFFQFSVHTPKIRYVSNRLTPRTTLPLCFVS